MLQNQEIYIVYSVIYITSEIKTDFPKQSDFILHKDFGQGQWFGVVFKLNIFLHFSFSISDNAPGLTKNKSKKLAELVVRKLIIV